MSAIPSSIITRNNLDIAEPTGNIYESISVIAKRAKQIGVKNKEELNQKLSEFASTVDNLEEIFENREQIEISRYYERMPKPTALSINEFMTGETYFRFKTEEEVEIAEKARKDAKNKERQGGRR